jgi:hypothetical protein
MEHQWNQWHWESNLVVLYKALRGLGWQWTEGELLGEVVHSSLPVRTITRIVGGHIKFVVVVAMF